MISVHVAARSAVVRVGLESVVRSSGLLTFSGAASTDSLEDHLDEITADVLLLALPRLTEEWIATLSACHVPAVILTDLPARSWPVSALRTSIRAVLSPDATEDEISAAIAGAAAGVIVIQPPALDFLLDRNDSNQRVVPEPLQEPLTPRELEVLALLAEGVGNKLIAHALGISRHTVKFHVTSIMAKLHAASRTDAVMQGIRRGLILL
jgi:NarL family two-component system response regulator YdfI